MKKSTIEMMHAYLNGQTVDLDTLRADVTAEYEKITAKSRANADMYDAAKPIVMAVLSEPLTVKEIYERTQSELPEGFTTSKIQYGLLNYWADEVIKTAGEGRNPNTYVKA